MNTQKMILVAALSFATLGSMPACDTQLADARLAPEVDVATSSTDSHSKKPEPGDVINPKYCQYYKGNGKIGWAPCYMKVW